MKPIIGPAGVASRGRLAFLAVGLVVCGACASKEPQRAAMASMAAPPQAHPTHAPPFKLLPDLITQRKAEFINHVTRDLAFDSGPAVDDRYLLEGPPGALRVGPAAKLASESNAKDLDSTFAWADAGRVLAKFVCVVRDTLHHQWGDIWAVLAGVTNNTVGYTARLPLQVKNKTGPARWFVGATDDNFCFPCNSKYCCTAEQ